MTAAGGVGGENEAAVGAELRQDPNVSGDGSHVDFPLYICLGIDMHLTRLKVVCLTLVI